MSEIFDILGDVSLSAEDRPPSQKKLGNISLDRGPELTDTLDEGTSDVKSGIEQKLERDDDEQSWLFGHTARYLLAGGIAGAGASCFPEYLLVLRVENNM